MRLLTFTGLTLIFPCPWFMFAVGGLLPLPVILLYGFEGGIVLAVSLVHVALYTGVFYWLARRAGAIVRGSRAKEAIAAALLLSALLALSFAPVYIEGENLASGHRAGRNAWQAYRDAWSSAFRGGQARRPPSPAEKSAAGR